MVNGRGVPGTEGAMTAGGTVVVYSGIKSMRGLYLSAILPVLGFAATLRIADINGDGANPDAAGRPRRSALLHHQRLPHIQLLRSRNPTHLRRVRR